MDRRALKFMQKRADTESDTTTPVSTTASQGTLASAISAGGTLPLKDNSNIREKPLHHNNNTSSQHTHSHQQQQQQQASGKQLERPLKCLETLAQKAGITFDEKYDVASPPHPGIAQQQATPGTGTATGTVSGTVTPTSLRHGTPPTARRHTHTPNTPGRPSAPSTPNTSSNSNPNSHVLARHTSLTLEKSQNPGQQVAATTTMPLQILPEQLQQFYASNPYAIQVKQEFPQHTGGGSGTELKHAANILEVQQQLQLQQQLSESNGGGATQGGAAGSPSPANSQQSQQQQHSTAISTMPPMQLATGGVGGDWSQGRTVQLMQPSTSFLYPQMIVSGNLLHPGGLGQQPIQVITAGKPFQGNGPQMLTTTTQNAKQMIGAQAGFAGGNYATCIPSNHNQSPQTLLISPVNVISHSPQQQQNLLQSMAAAAQQQQLTQQQQQQLSQQQQQQQLTQQQQQQQQQLTAALAKVGVDAQGKLAQKVVQKVTTTSSTVQAATGTGSAGTSQAQQVQQVQQQQQQTTQTTQQCVQVSQSTLPVGVGAQSVQTAQLLNAGQAQQMQIPWFWQNGLQPFGSNQIILRNQPDGTQGMFIQQQPATQTLQTQQNQIIQCNVTQTPTKARTQLDALAPKQQQQQQAGTTNQTQQQQLAVATAQLQQQQQQLTAATLQRPGAPIMPHNGTQVRPASSVSTQTAQNQSLLKAKMRNKQQPVRPALPTLKTENGQVAGQNKVVGHLTTVQQQQQATNLQQVVNAAGNKMVVMSTTGTPITLQNGQTLHAATAAGVDKQQQQMLIQKQQFLQQQMFQQQIAAIQMQQQAAVQAQQQQQQQQVTQQHQQVNAQQQQAVAQQQQAVAQAQQQQREQQQQVAQAQAQAQQQQALANATQQILQVAPNSFITPQQQQQLHNQLIQQQLQQQAQAQVQAQVQAQAQQQQQQREQQSIIQQIVVGGAVGATAQQQQQQSQQQTGQLQLSSVPFSVSSTTTPAGIATSSALQAALSASGAIFQTAKPGTCSSSSLPTSSVVTITNQSSTPLVTSSTVASLQQAQAQAQAQAAQIQQQQQQLINATIAAASQQQQQGPPSLTPTTPSPTTNPILAMTSMMNATVGHLSTAPPVTVSVTSTAVTPSPGQLVTLSSASSGGSFPATPTKDANSKAPTATLVPIDSPMTAVSGQDICTTPKSSASANISSSVEASSSTSEALPNGEVADRASTPSKTPTTPSSKQSNAVQPTSSSTTPNTVSGKEEPKVTTSSSSATSTPTTTTISNGIGIARMTGSTTASTTATTTTTTSSTSTTSCTSTTTTTTTSNTNGAKDLPKAMIKPNVLTHVIDGFIIQEANEPFPVTRQRYADKDVSDEPPKKKAAMQEDIKPCGIASAPAADMVACEQCGKLEHKSKLKRKRYCSPGCARQAKNGIGGVGSGETNGLGTGGIVGVDAMALVDKLDEAMAEEKMQTEALQAMSESLPIQAAPTEVPSIPMPVLAAIPASSPLSLPLALPLPVAIPPVPMAVAPPGVVTPAVALPSSNVNVNGSDRPPISSWSVEEVSNFIRELPGCQDYVDDFIQQEIDGQALLLLKENHLVHAMGMKLGPALKIVAKVESMKEVPPPGDIKDTALGGAQ